MSCDVGVHPVGVGLELLALFGIHCGDRFLSHLPQSKNALLAINAYEVRAQNPRQITGREASRHVHLPQTLLRRYVALCEEQIVKVRRSNRRDPQRIARHDHRLAKPHEANLPVLDGQRCERRAKSSLRSRK